MFFKIQAAWTNRDMGRVNDLLTPEMRGVLQAQGDRLRAERRINRLENIAVRQAAVTEGWQEKGQDFVTVYFLASLVDYTTDESGAQVLEGSRTEPVKFEEYWTFARPVGPNPWKLSAIQQGRHNRRGPRRPPPSLPQKDKLRRRSRRSNRPRSKPVGMKLISWNVNGLRAAWKKGLADFLVAERPDVLCVQETKIQEDQLTDEMRTPDGYRSHWCFAEKKGYSGVVTYTRQEPLAVAARCGSPSLDCEGRVIQRSWPTFISSTSTSRIAAWGPSGLRTSSSSTTSSSR